MPPNLTNRGGLVWRRRYRCGSPIQADDRAPVLTKCRATRGGLDVPQQMVKRRLRSPSPFDRPRGNSRRAASALRFVNRGRPLCGPAGRDGMRRGPTLRCALKKQQPWPIIRSKKYFGERRARPRCPAGPQDAQNAAQGRAWAGQPRREAPLGGQRGVARLLFRPCFWPHWAIFFLPGNPVRAPTVRWDSGKSPQIRDGGPHGQSGRRGAGGPRGEMDVRGGARPALRRPAGPSSPASGHPPTLPPDAAPPQ